MNKRFAADALYMGRLCKSPGHALWRAQFLSAKPFDLRDLFDRLDTSEISVTQRVMEVGGYSRNVDLFDRTRKVAYRYARMHSAGRDINEFRKFVIQSAHELNDFAAPLSNREVLGIAKSIIKWTLVCFTPERYSEIQRVRQAIGARKRSDKTAQLLAVALAEDNVDVGDIFDMANDTPCH